MRRIFMAKNFALSSSLTAESSQRTTRPNDPVPGKKFVEFSQTLKFAAVRKIGNELFCRVIRQSSTMTNCHPPAGLPYPNGNSYKSFTVKITTLLVGVQFLDLPTIER